MRLLCLLLVCLLGVSARAQTSLGATMISSLVATQGETITYTAVLTNRTSNAITGVIFSDDLDANTTFVAGSVNTSPLAFGDAYGALGNVQVTIPAPGALGNDVDVDGVGPALSITAATTTSANGGNVTIAANGGFTYNPPRGFEGIDTFTYQLNDGEGFTDIGTVSMTVTGMIWFVNSAAPNGGDGRLTSPFNFLLDLAAINNGASNNPAAGDTIFLHTGNYAGSLTLLNNQKFIGQGSSASITALTGLVPPPGSLPLPATGGVRPRMAGVILARDNLVRGLNIVTGGMVGGAVGVFTAAEMAVTNNGIVAINLNSGVLNVTLDSVTVNGPINSGLRLANCTGSFTVTGNGALAQNGTGGTIQNGTGNGIVLDNVTGVTLSRMNINTNATHGLFGRNVNGLVLDWCSFNNNGDATLESGIQLGEPLGANGVIGNARIANTLVRASGEMNVAIYNSAGTLSLLEVTNVVSRDTRTRPLGADGFYFETRGSAVATVNFASCLFSNNFTQGIQASAFGQSSLAINVANCGFTNNNEGVVLANANDADLTFDLNNNRFFNNLASGASGSAIAAVNATTVTPLASYSGKIRNNTISGGAIDNHAIAVLLAGAGHNTLEVANNNINAVNAQFSGIFLQAGETGSGNLNANVTVTGNTVSLGALGSHGIAIQSRITSTLCAEIANNTSATGGLGLFGINVRQRDTSTFRLPGYAGPGNSTPAVIAFLQGKNPAATIGATVATAYSGGAACLLPPVPPPPIESNPEIAQSFAAPPDSPGDDIEADPPVAMSPEGVVADVFLNIGTLPAAKSLTIIFQARIANPMPPGVCGISNQAVITHDGGIAVLTDDPRTGAPSDATLTTVRVPPYAVTLMATEITATSARLNASIIPGGDTTSYRLIHRPSPNVGPTGGAVINGDLLPAGCEVVLVSGVALALQPSTLYNFNVVASNNLGFSFGMDVSFMTLPPSFVQEPEDVVVCAGNVAAFYTGVDAVPHGGRFQWQRRDAGATDWQDIPLATNENFGLTATLADHGASFRVVFTGGGVTLISREALLSVNRLANPNVLYDFNSGLPADTAIYGHAFLDAANGVLELNNNAPSQSGAFLTTDLAPGRVVRGFAATFRARLLGGSFPPADGFSFNWATDLPNGVYVTGEEGQGSGLRVCFDTWDNGLGEAPAVDIFWGSNLVAHKSVTIPFLVRGPNFFDVQIRLSANGLLDVIYGCDPVFSQLPVTGYTPQMGARFGLASRAGAAFETHSIDDLALELYLDPTSNLPRITSITLSAPPAALIKGTGAPNQNYSLESSPDLATWTWRAPVVTDAGGLWQTTVPVFAGPHAFYRLKGAPQFPPGLVTWYRADGNYGDSFGPNHGTPEGGITFASGQRGQAFSLNGVTDAMFIGGAAIPVPWTAAFWVNRQDTPDISAALLSDNVSALKLEQWPSTRQVGFTQFGVADYSFGYIAPAGTWLQLTLVGSPAGTTLYVNGAFVQTISAVVSLPLQTLGRRGTGQDRLRGLLDEITIFNRALSPAEIQQLHNTTRGP